jgi:hypothetical protein
LLIALNFYTINIIYNFNLIYMADDQNNSKHPQKLDLISSLNKNSSQSQQAVVKIKLSK